MALKTSYTRDTYNGHRYDIRISIKWPLADKTAYLHTLTHEDFLEYLYSFVHEDPLSLSSFDELFE